MITNNGGVSLILHARKITAKERKQFPYYRVCSYNKKGERNCFEKASHIMEGDPYCENHTIQLDRER